MDDSRRGAQRHANANFLGLAGNGIGDDAVNAESGEDEAEGGEGGDEIDKEFAWGDGVIDQRLDGTESVVWLRGIIVAQDRHDGSGKHVGGKLGANDELGALGTVEDGKINFRAWRRFEAGDANVSDNADDGAGFVIEAASFAADGRLSGPMTTRGGFIDDNDGLFVEGVLPSNVATLDETDTHGVEIAWSDDTDDGALVFLFAIFARGIDESPAAIAIEREHVGDASGFDAGNRFYIANNFLKRGTDFFALGTGVVLDVDDGGVAGLETEIDIEDAEEAAKKQAGANEENAGEGDFADDEDGTHTAVGSIFAGTSAGIFESFLRVAAGNGESRGKTNEDADAERDEESPREGGAIDANTVEKRKGDGTLVREVRNDAERDGNAERGANGGEHERFRDKLANQASAGGAESTAHGELFAAGSEAREKKIGKIDADDEKDETDSAPEDEERASEFTGDVVF